METTTIRGIPTTSLWRTVVDLAARRPEPVVRKAIDAIFATDRFDQVAVERQLALGRRGTPLVRTILAKRHPDAHRTRSSAEDVLLALIEAHDLPRPEVNPLLADAGIEPDLLWRRERVIVELDTRTYHSGDDVFERDRWKTATLQDAGYEVRRSTRTQVEEQPEWVIASIRAALRHRNPR